MQAQLDALQLEQKHAAVSPPGQQNHDGPTNNKAVAQVCVAESAGGQHAGLDGKLQGADAALAALQEEHAEVMAEKADLQAQCGELEAAKTALSAEAQAVKQELAAAQKQAEASDRLSQQLAQAEGAVQELQVQLSGKKAGEGALAALQEQLSEAKACAAAHEAALKERDVELEELREEGVTLQQQCAQLQALQASYRAHILELERVLHLPFVLSRHGVCSLGVLVMDQPTPPTNPLHASAEVFPSTIRLKRMFVSALIRRRCADGGGGRAGAC